MLKTTIPRLVGEKPRDLKPNNQAPKEDSNVVAGSTSSIKLHALQLRDSHLYLTYFNIQRQSMHITYYPKRNLFP